MNVYKKAGALLLAVMLVAFQWLNVAPHALAKTVENSALISVQDKNGKTVLPMVVVQLKKGETALEVLKGAAKSKNIKVNTSESSGMGEYVDSIGGIHPKYSKNNPVYWGFFINGITSQKGLSNYKVHPGDDLLLKVVKGQPKTVDASISILKKNGDPILKHTKVQNMAKGAANAYDVLKQATKQNDVKLNVALDDTLGAKINGIGGVTPKWDPDQEYWQFTADGKVAQMGPSSYSLKKGGAKFKFKFQVTGSKASSGDNQHSGKEKTSTHNKTEEGKKDTTSKTSSISDKQIETAIDKAVQAVLKDGVDSYYDAIGLRQTGKIKEIPQNYLNGIKQQLKDNQGQFRNVTDYEKFVLGITAANKDATNFAGYNLVKDIYTNDRMTNQGTNGPIYALLALDSGNYKVPNNAKWTRKKLIGELLKHQHGGSWGLTDNDQSVDITAMALAAIAPYKNSTKVAGAINEAVQWLANRQNHLGGFDSEYNGGDSSESTAQVIAGLTAVGVNPTGKDFTRNGHNLLNHLLQFQRDDGGFAHIYGDKKSNPISTPQALVALAAYQNYEKGKGSVFQLQAKKKENTVDLNKSQSRSTHSNHKIGGKLPETATNQFNFLLFGIVLLGMGIALYFYSRRRKKA